MSHVMCYKLHDARECVLPPGNLWKPPASSTPFGSSPRAGDTPCLPVQPASGLRLGSAAYSLSLVAASLDVPPSTGGEGGTPLHPLARLLPRQSAARKRSDTCRETRGLVRSVSRYVTSSPLHSGRPRELPASSRTSFPVRVVKICFLHYCFGLRLFVFFGLLHDFRPPRQLLRLQFAIFPAKLALFPTNFPCNKNNFRAHNFTLIVSV